MSSDDGLLLLDLDRTLLDTDAFAKRASYTFNPNRPTLLTDALKQTSKGAGRFHTHSLATAAGLLGTTAEHITDTLAAQMGADDLLYPDAQELLANLDGRDTTILTFGDPDWQHLKLRCSGLAERHPSVVVSGPKSEAITKRWPHRHGWLVDDKPGQDLPAGWTEVWLDRSGTGNNAPPGARRITSLLGVPAATWAHLRLTFQRRRPQPETPARQLLADR